jgi:hypothetical protein
LGGELSTILIHAGAAKSGSSSIQVWLRAHAEELRREKDIQVVVASLDQKLGSATTDDCRVRITPFEGGRVNCGPFMRLYFSEGADKETIAESFAAGLREQADRHTAVVVSCEALAQAFCRKDERFVAELDELGRFHEVRIAYFTRPQHTSLESAWKQWGFRSGLLPSDYIRERSTILHYYDTLVWTEQNAPNISFDVRPVRQDLLDGGGVVSDFTRRFFDFDDTKEAGEKEIWKNKGLPLDIVNLLAKAPPDHFWDSIHDNIALDRLKDSVRGIQFSETDDARRSRALLQRYCFNLFENENRKLIEILGWKTDYFIAPPGDNREIEAVDLAELDHLWMPKASEPELQLLFWALERAISSNTQPERGPDTGLRFRIQRALRKRNLLR